MQFETNSISDYSQNMRSVFEAAGDKKIWLFTGDLGSGKTSMIQQIMKYLECEDEVTSPSFSLVNEYRYPKGKVYHMDLYRIKDIDEAINIGIEEYLNSGSYCFIEWPEIAEPIFDEDSFKIRIEILDLTRRKINLH